MSRLALELGDDLEALDLNPVIAGPDGAIAVDALVLPRRPDDHDDDHDDDDRENRCTG